MASLTFFFHFNDEIFELSGVDNYSSCLIDSVERVENFDIEIDESFEDVGDEEPHQTEVLGRSTVRCPFKRIVGGGRCNHVTDVQEQLFCGDGIDLSVPRRTIFAPSYMFTGAVIPFDNLVQVNNPDRRIAYRNAAELIDPQNDYYITQPPLNHFRDKVLPDSIKKNPFQMDWGFAWPRAPLVDYPRRIEFDSDGMSICPAVVNDRKFNVTATNVLEEDMVVSFVPPNSMLLPSREYTGDICKSDRTRWMDLCELFWLSPPPCRPPPAGCPPWGCDLVAFWVDAPLGSGERCEVGDCGIRYWEAGRILTAPPSRARNMYPKWLTPDEIENDFIVDDPVILTAPAFAIKNGYYAGDSLWDFSIWQHVYSLEQVFTYPGYYGTMSEDDYWLGVANEIGAVVEMKGFRDIEYGDTTPVPPEFAVAVSVKGNGSIVGSQGISCSGSCNYSIPQGTEITVKAIPQDDSSFAGWLVPKACMDQSEQCRVTVSYEPFTIIASFNYN